jgi:hypothetical protein
MQRNLLNPIYIKAFIDFITIWGQTEISSDCEIDFIILFNYVQSDSFLFKHLEIREADSEKLYIACMKELEQEVLDGFPLWHFLKISDKLKDILDKQLEDSENKRLKCYLCFNCKFLHIDKTSLGDMYDCDNTENCKRLEKVHHFERWHFSPFTIKKCKFFENKNDKK